MNDSSRTPSYTTIPLPKAESGHLYLECTINGTAADFILDTGAGATIIDEKSADKFGLATTESENTAAGAGGNMTLKEAVADRIEIDGFVLEKFTVHVMELAHINDALTQTGMPVAEGVIGADILSAGKAIIDYAALTLRLEQ